MKFKIMILQSLYNLSDVAVKFQVKDRLSFMGFLNLSLADRVPDGKTVWAFREELGKLGLESKLFEKFDGCLREHGFSAKKGQIVDVAICSDHNFASKVTCMGTVSPGVAVWKRSG